MLQVRKTIQGLGAAKKICLNYTDFPEGDVWTLWNYVKQTLVRTQFITWPPSIPTLTRNHEAGPDQGEAHEVPREQTSRKHFWMPSLHLHNPENEDLLECSAQASYLPHPSPGPVVSASHHSGAELLHIPVFPLPLIPPPNAAHRRLLVMTKLQQARGCDHTTYYQQ